MGSSAANSDSVRFMPPYIADDSPFIAYSLAFTAPFKSRFQSVDGGFIEVNCARSIWGVMFICNALFAGL
jgi:hypothetical protein